jgi:transcriptional regulator with GAF, ATPase, and Fis domain
VLHLRAPARPRRPPGAGDLVAAADTLDRDWIGEVHALDEIPGLERVIRPGEVQVAYRNDEVDKSASVFGSMAFWGESAVLWAPVVHGGDVLGVLELTEKDRPRTFDEPDRALARQMASLAAIALHNARISRAAEERNRQLTALIDASRAMTSTLDLDEVLDVVCRQAALALDAGSSYI